MNGSAMNKTDFALTFGFALSSNLDNVWVGMAYGLRRIRIPFAANLAVAAVTGAGSLAAMLAGGAIGQMLAPGLSGRWAGLLLLGMGGYGLVGRRRDGGKPIGASGEAVSPSAGAGHDPAGAERIGGLDLLLMALALSVNNLLSGVAAGMTDLSPLPTTLLVVVLSVATLSAGLRIGTGLGRRPGGRQARILSAALLIGLGLYEIFL